LFTNALLNLLTIPLAATFVKNMMESNIFHTNDIADFLFCLIAGIFLAYSYEQLPLSRKMKDFMCRISDAESRRKEKIPLSALR
jgi:hypothetical protein